MPRQAPSSRVGGSDRDESRATRQCRPYLLLAQLVGRFRPLGVIKGMSGTEPTSAAVAEPIVAEGPLLCPHQAASLLSVKPSWIYEAVRAHRIPCLRVGRHIRFTRAMLEQWLADQVDG
jgi:excisionase family DNA binding protein